MRCLAAQSIRGFTLIEVLVVLVILAIVAKLIVGRGVAWLHHTQARSTCDHITQQLHHWQQQTWSEQRTIGVWIKHQQLVAQTYTASHTWEPLPRPGMAERPHPMPSLHLLSSEHDQHNQAFILLLPAWVTNTFKLSGSTTQARCVWQSAPDMDNPQPILFHRYRHDT